MTALEPVLFGLAMFGALAALLQWRHRRSLKAARLNRGLREFIAAEGTEQPEQTLSTVLGPS